MKKFLALLLSAILLLSFTACKGKKDNDDTTSKPASEPSTSQDENSQDGNSQGGTSQGGTSQGGNSQGGTSQGGTSQGGTSQGGTSQGGASQGGTSQGGTSQGGTSQGGTSQGGTSQGGTSQGGTSQGGNSQGGTSQGGSQTPSVETTDLTVYVPYKADISDNNVQVLPPELDSNNNIGLGETVDTHHTEAPVVFDAKKAITAFKNESSSITAAKLQEYLSKYATAYNNYYNKKSSYKLAVSVSGNTVKYTYTVTGKLAEDDNTRLKLTLDEKGYHFDKYSDFYNSFYKDQIKSYKSAMSKIDKIEICIVRADDDPNLGKPDFSKNILSKTYS